MLSPKEINKEFLDLSKSINVKQFADSVRG